MKSDLEGKVISIGSSKYRAIEKVTFKLIQH